MSSARQFIQTEVDGLQALLNAAYRPPCGKNKAHRWPGADAEPEKYNICVKCGWSRANWRRMGKKDHKEITARVDRLNEILQMDTVNQPSSEVSDGGL